MSADWRRRALCADLPTDLFYPVSETEVPDEVKEACSACPVRRECLDYAIERGDKFGIWGGVPARERSGERRRRMRRGELVVA